MQERTEFESFEEENKTITTSDLVALHINNTQYYAGAYDFVIEDNADIDVNRKIIQASYNKIDDAGTPFQPYDDTAVPWSISALFVLSEDRNTGYVVQGPPIYNPHTGIRTEESSAMEQLFNSFELVTSD